MSTEVCTYVYKNMYILVSYTLNLCTCISVICTVSINFCMYVDLFTVWYIVYNISDHRCTHAHIAHMINPICTYVIIIILCMYHNLDAYISAFKRFM